MLRLHTVSRDKLFDATAIFENEEVTVLKGSRINIRKNPNFKPPELVSKCLSDDSLVGSDGILKRDITFRSLSTAATFVAGRISNGMITWKTEDGRYVRYALKGE